MSKYSLRIQLPRSMLSNSYAPEVHRSSEHRPGRNCTTGIWAVSRLEDTKTYAGSNPQCRIPGVSEPLVSVIRTDGARADGAARKAYPAEFTPRESSGKGAFRTAAAQCRRWTRDSGSRPRRPLQS